MSGTIVVSVDAELGWGYRDHDPFPVDRIARSPDNWRRLVELFDRFEVPATWAVVGHLLADPEEGFRTDLPSLAGLPPEGQFPRSRPEWWFGRDLVAAVLDSSPDHELASHSFSHVEFDEDRTSRDLARAELAASVEAGEEFGVTFDTFVYPRNRIGYRDLLAEFGFTCYRGQSWVHRRGSALTKPVRNAMHGTPLADRSFLVEPTVDEYGLVNVPASLYLFSFEGFARRLAAPVVGDPVVEKARRGVDLAARRDGMFHLWLHPNDLHVGYAFDRLEAIFEYVDERRDGTEVTVETMGTVADRCRPSTGVER